MSAPEAMTTETVSGDYNASYYAHYVPGVGEYAWETEHWRTFFLGIADRIVGLLAPKTSLDVGCARGLFVQALMTRGVDAQGFDLSQDAIETAHPDVRDRLRVGSATEPIEGRYDLVTCVEVLEHMEAADAQKAIDSICAVTDVVLFSSCPDDYEETTHVNTNPTAQWAAWFAERGFFRRADADASFLAPWAILFERAPLTQRAVVERYERQLEPMRNEVAEKRRALLELHRSYSELEASAGRPGREIELDDDVLQARHTELTARDHVAGLEAQAVLLGRQLDEARLRLRKLRDRNEDLEQQLSAVQGSRAWRIGSAVVSPVRKLRR